MNKENHVNLGRNCPLAFTLNIIGSKWALPTIWLLNRNGTMRFNELKRGMEGITNIMLTQTLKTLEQYDIIIRKQYNEVPLRVEYSISENGKTLLPLLEDAAQWGREQQEKRGESIGTTQEPGSI